MATALAFWGHTFIPATPAVDIGRVHIPVEIARDDASLQKGLSGRVSLDPEKGMLFVFPKPDIYPFWMPDMYFPIDIIWINSGYVVDITADVPNDFDPHNPKFYAPKTPVQYVLEVNAGFARTQNINIGDKAVLRI
ncbi:MAG: hypothetical protein A3B23_01265 [Candidatus Colwellbacteria bacterium RIFCSPLOWO2_01_FULL_48_10]|uniref:DUF192 domain-containing protein n=2 Tax=Bacteria candidate phyla TaxID=1783234 RepID=A0A1F5P1W5_9BACT|nr:MAG: hypothetical protein A2846_05045 [Candidatus Doudnabacteria bacterium RIFCSPHIGHO2_01_FULL_49_9]OGY59583.1 MAG: hypothetical protein A3B23_01265 [Candidatus Colwellbacteria bacterium RIFCSPLOWO2_01_FULL_48_10]